MINTLLLLPLLFLTFPPAAHAICPVCTVAVGAGLGLSRYLGVDDIISGLWIGGFLLSSSFWLDDWLTKKYPKYKNFEKLTALQKKVGIAILFYLITLVPLYYSEVIGHPFNTIFGIDKLVFGTALGSLLFLIALWADKKVRKVRGKQLFNYQKVAFPIGILVLASIIMYLISKFLISNL